VKRYSGSAILAICLERVTTPCSELDGWQDIKKYSLERNLVRSSDFLDRKATGSLVVFVLQTQYVAQAKDFRWVRG
jgi:hypothetical protein